MKTTKWALAIALGAVALVAPGGVRADTIFTATGVCCPVTGGESLSGTVTINTSTGVVDATHLTISGTLLTSTFTIIGNQFVNGSNYQLNTQDQPGTGNIVILVFPTPSLSGFTGGPICSTTNQCLLGPSILFSGGSQLPFSTLTLTPVPDPPSIILLGTGLVGLMGMGWRRKRLA